MQVRLSKHGLKQQKVEADLGKLIIITQKSAFLILQTSFYTLILKYMFYLFGYQIDVLEILSVFMFLLMFEAIVYITNYTSDDENHFSTILILALLQFIAVVFWSIFF